MNIQPILWNQLVSSPRNVRKAKTGIDTLAASIAAEGLLQNLVVIPREDGKYEVVAGERRRRAIRQLVKAKQWAKDSMVSCEVRMEDATAISYAENAQRVAMHPADAIRAFGQLADEGQTEEAIAHRFGYDPREVRKLLALASLSPKVLAALAADKITVETAQAFTLTDDHARQNRVLRNAGSAHQVRRLLTDAKLGTNHRLFRFVGLDAYEQAGGTLTIDLFKTDGGFADDPDLVARLAGEKLGEARAQAEAEGWPTVIAAENAPSESHNWHTLYPDEDGNYSAEAKANARLLLTIDYEGELSAHAYRMRSPKKDASSPALPRPLYDSRTEENLSRVRTAALQAELAANHRVAFAALLDALLPIVTQEYTHPGAIQLRSAGRAKTAEEGMNLARIAAPLDGVADLLGTLPDDEASRFAWVLAMDETNTHRLLAACTAALLDATYLKDRNTLRVHSADRIARALGLDMRKHWEGGVDFYSRLTRKAMLQALTEARSPEAAFNCEKLKKDKLAEQCVERIAGTGWLPPALLTPQEPAPLAPDLDEATEDDEPEWLEAAE